MKIRLVSCLLLVPLTVAAEVKPRAKPHFADSPSSQELNLAYRKSSQRDPMKTLVKIPGEDPTKSNQPVNLLEQSDIICFGGVATLVPKRAILTLPVKYKDCMKLKPGSKIVGWAEFYAVNRGWITTVEVSRVQAEGNKAFAKDASDRITKSMNLVVATFSGGPISVLPLKQPEANTETVKVTP
ncbi:MAG: hypothetical protein RLZZ214_3469 [Verrucomicrobiota bacterium]|jgi:hypothetical protein